MKRKLIFMFLLLAFFIFDFGFTQQIDVPLIVHTGSDPDYNYGDSLFLQIQVAVDSLFANKVLDVDFPCQPDTDITYNLQVIQTEMSKTYWWKARHRDGQNVFSEWTPPRHFRFEWVNSPPSGCSCISPANGIVIEENR
jgi:hypothetical protein